MEEKTKRLSVLNIFSVAVTGPQPKSGDLVLSSGLISSVLLKSAIFLFVVGVFLLVLAIIRYFLAAGEEPSMKKANNTLWGALGFILFGIVFYFVAQYLK